MQPDHKYQLTRKTILFHALCWAIFIIYEGAVFYHLTRNLPLFLHSFYYYPLSILLFYTEVYVLQGKRKVVNKVFLLITIFLFFLCLKSAVDLLLIDNGFNNSKTFGDIQKYIPNNLSRNIYFTMLAIFYWLIMRVGRDRHRAVMAERDRLAALNGLKESEMKFAGVQNAYLQQQMNPHMLFNTLSFIHSDIIQASPIAADCVRELSELLRYGIDHQYYAKVTLAEEAEQVRHMIRINRMRFGDELAFSYAETTIPESAEIIPMALVTLTENVFKHGLLTAPERPALITLNVEEGCLIFRTINHLKRTDETPARKKTGLENLRARLAYSYGNDFELSSGNDGPLFITNLRISI